MKAEQENECLLLQLYSVVMHIGHRQHICLHARSPFVYCLSIRKKTENKKTRIKYNKSIQTATTDHKLAITQIHRKQRCAGNVMQCNVNVDLYSA